MALYKATDRPKQGSTAGPMLPVPPKPKPNKTRMQREALSKEF